MDPLPEGYKPVLDVRQTEQAIKLVKDFFERSLSAELRLFRVTAPLFVEAGSGINDDLNGVERPVGFEVPKAGGKRVEVVQSLAKWKRMALADYGYGEGSGIYADMNALRPDDDVDAIHSVYVDQWDWELVVSREQRTEEFLRATVRKIYDCVRRAEFVAHERYPALPLSLPRDIAFFSASEARKRYPGLSPQERERELAREHGAVFVQGIGWPLEDGKPHGGRAPDYDDWNLNGDIIVWDHVRGDSLELSSMGIRVDRESLLSQLKAAKAEARKELYWHKRLLVGEFPLTMGGGIGQSRLCMLLLRKAHIGEVQASVWPEGTREACAARGVQLM
jgi:aspartate--ammonia ligase